MLSRIMIVGIYLYMFLVQGPWAAYALWRRSHRRAQRFRMLYGRLHVVEEIQAIETVIDDQLWYERVLHRQPSDEELDQIIRQAMREHGYALPPGDA